MRRLLFVDDEAQVLDGLRNLLHGHRKQWDLVFALGADAALEAMRERPADIVVSDMRMPKMDGAALLTRIQKDYPSTVRIVLSGHAEHAAAVRALGVAHQFLSKPCDLETLTSTIERACGVLDLIASECVRELMGKIVALPVRPEIHSMIVNRLRDPNVTSEDVAQLIERDMAMVAKMLQLANSGYFGLPRRITRLSDAVGFLGFRMIENLAFSLAVFDAGRRSRGVDVAALQRHALHTGVIARALVSDHREADDAFLAGMLHDLGIFVAASHLPDHFERTIAVQHERLQPLHEVEFELWGVAHPAVGGYLLGLWNLPIQVVEAVVMHHTLDPLQPSGGLAGIVHVADVFAHELAGAPCPVEHDPAPSLNMDYLEAVGLAKRIDELRELALTTLENRAEAA